MSQPTGTVQMIAVLKDNAGNPLSGKTITFSYKLSSATDWTTADSAITDDTGTATYTLTLPAPNTYDFKAEFAGDNQYFGSYATVTNVTVKAGTVITLTVQQIA